MVKQSVSQAFSRIDTMEQFERVMATMTGSSEKAAQVLDTVNDAVTGTAYGLDVAAKSTQDFVTSGMEVDKATDSIASWGDAVAFYGDGSNESFASVTDALSKMTAKGKVQMDTMNRLTEAGIPAMQIYADATGQSVQEVADQMQRGELDAEDFMDVMNDAMVNGTDNFDSIKGAAKDAGASWGASFDNMKAAVARGMVAIISAIDEMLTSSGLPDMRTMVAEFGSKFESVLESIAGAIPAVVSTIQDWWEKMKPIQPLLIAIAQAVGIVVAAIATFGTVITTINLIKMAVQALNMTVLLNPWTLIAVAAVVAVLLIIKYWEPISEFFVNLWDGVKTIFKAAYNWINDKTGGAFGAYVDIIQSSLQTALTIVKAVWGYIKESFSNVLDFLKALVKGDFQGMKDAMRAQMKNAQNLLKTIWNAIKSHIGNVLNSIKSIITTVWNGIKSVISSVIKAIKSVISSGFNSTKSVINSVIKSIKSVISSGFNTAKSVVSSVTNSIKSTVSRIFNSLKSVVTGAMNGVKNAVSNGIRGALNVVKNIASQFVSAGRNIVSSIAKGITGAIGKVTGAISKVTSKIRDFLPFSPAKEGALKDIMKVRISESIAESIRRGKSSAVGSMKDLSNSIRNEMNPVDVGDMVNDINRQTGQLNHTFNSNLNIQKQPVVIQVEGDAEWLRAYVNDNNATDIKMGGLARGY